MKIVIAIAVLFGLVSLGIRVYLGIIPNIPIITEISYLRAASTLSGISAASLCFCMALR